MKTKIKQQSIVQIYFHVYALYTATQLIYYFLVVPIFDCTYFPYEPVRREHSLT